MHQVVLLAYRETEATGLVSEGWSWCPETFKPRVPGTNNCIVLPPMELWEVLTGVTWGYLKVPYGPRHCLCPGIRQGVSPKTWLTVCFPPEWLHLAVVLPIPSHCFPHPRACPSHPAPQGLQRRRSCFTREQRDFEAAGPPPPWAGVSDSFISSSNKRLSACVPLTVLGTGGSLSLQGAHAALSPPHLGWGPLGSKGICTQKTASHPEPCHREPGEASQKTAVWSLG